MVSERDYADLRKLRAQRVKAKSAASLAREPGGAKEEPKARWSACPFTPVAIVERRLNRPGGRIFGVGETLIELTADKAGELGWES